MSALIPFLEIILEAALFAVAMVMLLVLSAIIGFLPAILAAVVVWFLSHSLFYAALAFVAVAFLWALVKRK